jgi:antitoxin YobK
MERTDFETRFAAAREERSGGVQIEGFSPFDLTPATQDDIVSAETALDLRLPQQYREFMLDHGAGMFLFVDLLPIRSTAGPEDLISRNSGRWRTPDFLAVSPVGTGDWWGFVIDDHECSPQVYFWRHDDDDRELSYDDFYTFLTNQGLKAG